MKKYLLPILMIFFLFGVAKDSLADGVQMNDWFEDIPYTVPFVAPNGQTYTKSFQIRSKYNGGAGNSQTVYFLNENSTVFFENYVNATAIRAPFTNAYKVNKYPPTSQPEWSALTWSSGSFITPNTGVDTNDNLLITDFFRSNFDIYFSSTTAFDYSVNGTHSYWGLGNTATNQLIIPNQSFNGGGTPECSSWDYSAWSSCQENDTRTRTITASYPANCEGGTPAELSEYCAYADSILVPDTGAYLPIGLNTFSGACKNLGLHYSMNWRDFNFSETPNITCQNDYTWSNDYEISETGGGGREYFLYNHETEEILSVIVMGYNADSPEYFINLQYPALDSNNYAKTVIDDAFPIRVKYILPISMDRTVFGAEMLKYTDSTYTTTSGTEFHNTFSVLDEFNTGFITEVPIDIVEEMNYFILRIYDSGTSTIKYSVKIKLEGMTDETGVDVNPAELPDEKDLGFWGNLARDLFIPPMGSMTFLFQTIQQELETRAPFAYFYMVQSKFSNISVGSTNTALALTIDAGISSINFPVLDFANANIAGFISTLRTMLGYALYILLTIYLYYRIVDMFKT